MRMRERRPLICDICGDLMQRGIPHYCPPVDDRYDSADSGVPIRLEPYGANP